MSEIKSRSINGIHETNDNKGFKDKELQASEHNTMHELILKVYNFSKYVHCI